MNNGGVLAQSELPATNINIAQAQAKQVPVPLGVTAAGAEMIAQNTTRVATPESEVTRLG